jgi:type II secretory pathway component PulF
MSRDQEDFEPPDPPRARPTGDSSAKKSRPAASDLGESTFRPNPIGTGSAGKSRGSKKPGPYDRPEKFEVPVGGPSWWERILFGRISSGQLSQFCRQFASYLNAGVDITRALSSLEKQNRGTALGPILSRILVSIRRGSTLEEAMAHETRAFGPMFLNMIKVAEARGGVPETLKMLAQHFEARQRLIRQARSAMIYPAIVVILASGVVALITVVLLPMFVSLLADIGKKSTLPWPSRVLMGFSQFVQSGGWWIMPAVAIGTPFVLFRIYKTEPGKAIMDRLILMVPVFGSLCRKIDTTRFARTLSVLLNAGVDIGQSIDLTADVLMMSPIQRAVRACREQIISGKELSGTLASSRQFAPDVIAVIGSGEETGKLPESLAHLADDYEEQVSITVANLGQLVQPLLIGFVGLIVFFIILAVFLPYIQMITSLSGGG